MTGGWRDRRKSRPAAPAVTSRADWRGLIVLARQCAVDAVSDLLDREAGFTTAETARALVRLARAFAGLATSGETRREMAPALTAVAALLDDQLHALSAREFQRAHAGRPEVWG
jgi:hypothetical protein